MKIFLIFATLLLSINSFSYHTARDVVEGLLQTIYDSEFKLGEKCITENFDLILNDMYYFAHEYYYSYNQEKKMEYLINFLLKMLDLFNETSNCNLDNIDFMKIGVIISIVLRFPSSDKEFWEKKWKSIVEIENKLIDAYHSKEFSGLNFGKALGIFLYDFNDLLSNN